MADVIRCVIMVQNICLGTDRSVMPLQLLQSDSAPFCGTLSPFLSSDGVFLGRRMLAANTGSALKSSVFNLSALSFF